MIDLADEFSAAACSLTPKRLDLLREAGVEHCWPLNFGCSPIETHSNGLYEPAEQGRYAVLVPVGHHDELNWHLDDICAFYPEHPERWWRRTGDGLLLGTANGFSILEPRRLHSRPLDWLCDQGRGACILDWSEDPADLLMSVGSLVADRAVLNKLRKTAIKAATARMDRMVSYG